MSNKRVARLLFLSLGEKPETIGVYLDDNNYTTIIELLKCLIFHGEEVDLKTLTDIIDNDYRFEFDQSRSLVRVRQDIDIRFARNYTEKIPPQYLFVTVDRQYIPDITIRGLHGNKNKQFVSLKKDIKSSRGNAVYCIHALQMHRDGYSFFNHKDKWAVTKIPCEYMSLVSM